MWTWRPLVAVFEVNDRWHRHVLRHASAMRAANEPARNTMSTTGISSRVTLDTRPRRWCAVQQPCYAQVVFATVGT